MAKLLEMLDSARKDYLYKSIKNKFEELCKDDVREFDMNWLKKNLDSVKNMFVFSEGSFKGMLAGKSDLDLWYYSDKSDFSHAGSIADITMDDDRIVFSTRNSGIALNSPSHGCFIIEKGIGNRYAMYLYSKENKPSQIILSYHNI